MNRRSFVQASGAMLAGGAIGVAGCVGTAPTVQMRSENVGTDREAHYFDPIGLHVESGTTVTFEVDGGGIHTSTAYDTGTLSASVTRIPRKAEGWDSKLIDGVSSDDPTFDHPFEVPGTYDYFCRNHKDERMVGRVVVDEPGGPAEGSMPPDGRVPESRRIVREGTVSYDAFG